MPVRYRRTPKKCESTTTTRTATTTRRLPGREWDTTIPQLPNFSALAGFTRVIATPASMCYRESGARHDRNVFPHRLADSDTRCYCCPRETIGISRDCCRNASPTCWGFRSTAKAPSANRRTRAQSNQLEPRPDKLPAAAPRKCTKPILVPLKFKAEPEAHSVCHTVRENSQTLLL